MVMVVPNEVPGTGRSSSKQMFAEATTGNRRLTSSAGRLDGGAPTANYLFQLLDNNFTGELPQAFKRIDAIADAEQQVAILAAVNSQGAPALAKLFLEGDKHTQAVSMFTTAVLASEVLSSKQKTELLMARLPEPFAIRGFLTALGGGQTKVLTTFMQLVLHSPALSPEEKYRLLEMKATHDTDFLKDAIADGLGNTVIAYKEALARSPLSQQMISDMQTHG
ncbi:MAG: hypothetical protein H7234_04490 [Herminiimonas sp.]|nr:hypothetical protein [Herminiimonas sp.]